MPGEPGGRPPPGAAVIARAAPLLSQFEPKPIGGVVITDARLPNKVVLAGQRKAKKC